jgi:hypothetical protein
MSAPDTDPPIDACPVCRGVGLVATQSDYDDPCCDECGGDGLAPAARSHDDMVDAISFAVDGFRIGLDPGRDQGAFLSLVEVQARTPRVRPDALSAASFANVAIDRCRGAHPAEWNGARFVCANGCGPLDARARGVAP